MQLQLFGFRKIAPDNVLPLTKAKLFTQFFVDAIVDDVSLQACSASCVERGS
jgi:hypothetical protein